MRILFHIEPLQFHNRPFHYWAWLARAASMGRNLASRDWDVRWVMNAALGARATSGATARRGQPSSQGHSLPREQILLLHQDPIRRLYDAPNMAILEGLQNQHWPEVTRLAHGSLVRDGLAGFTPDVILTWTPSDHLRAVYPDALILHTENGLFSREPYPPFQFFDPQGLYGRSILATHAEGLRGIAANERERAWLEGFRARVRAHHAGGTVFHELERSMRAKYRKLVLLPLQFAGEAGFDLNAPFRNQGEFLWHVLERLPPDVGLVVTEHPIAHWVGDVIDEETREYLAAAAPQARFVPLSAALHGGQTLLHHCDAAISVSSSLGLQALFFGRTLISPGRSHLRAWARSEDPAALAEDMPALDLDGAMAWLLRHYFVRDARCLQDGEWLDTFLRRSHAKWASGVRGLEFFEPCEALEPLERAMLAAIPEPPRVLDAAAAGIRNGDFAEEEDGRPAAWHLLAGRKARARLLTADGPQPGGASRAARVARTRVGESPTLLLQRVPDATRLAGAAVTVDLMARGPLGSSLSVYLFQQTGQGGGAAQGTTPQSFGLEPDWQALRYTARLPHLDPTALGAGHHTELVLLLPPDLEGEFEVSGVRLSPARFG